MTSHPAGELERDASIELRIVGDEHVAHAAAAEPLNEDVVPQLFADHGRKSAREGRSARTCSVRLLECRGARCASCISGRTTSRPARRCAPARPELRSPGPPTAAMGRHVERGSDVRFEVLEKRLERVQHGLRPLLQHAPDSLEELADLPLVVGLAPPERERRPERLADFLQKLFEGAPRLGRRALNVPVLEPLPGTGEFPSFRSGWSSDPRRSSGRELELAPGALVGSGARRTADRASAR